MTSAEDPVVHRTTLDSLSAQGRHLAANIQRSLFGSSSEAALGRFVLLDVLGRGGMGVVYRAYDPELDRQVAVKVLASTDATARERMLREAKLLAQLGHPNVVAIHEVGKDRGELFVAMELVDGGTLLEWCREHCGTGSGRVRRILALAHQAIDGLAAAHALGIVHRDIKPTNLLIGSDERLRVADFGLARAGAAIPDQRPTVDSTPDASLALTHTGTAVGTPAYMPPEQYAGRADAQSDQFSLCASVFEALCGERPYPGKSPAELLDAMESGRLVPAPRSVPRAVLAVLHRGLRARPEDRYPELHALGRALQRAERRPRVLGSMGLLVLTAGLATVASTRESADPGVHCAQQAEAAAPSWANDQRQRIRSAFLATDLGFAEGSWSMAEAAMTRWRTDWIGAEGALCRTRADPQGADLDELQAESDCLTRSAENFAALANTLEAADADAVRRSLTAAMTLPDPQRCRERGFERSLVQARDEDMPSLEPLFRARHEQRLGQLEQAQEHYQGVLDDLGDRATPLRAWVRCELASVSYTRGDYEDAATQALAGLDLAELADDSEAAIFAWRMLTSIRMQQDRVPELELSMARADSLARRAEVSDQTRARLDWGAAAVLSRLHRYEEALPRFERALPHYEAQMRDHPQLASLRCDYSEALFHTGHVDPALEHAERCRADYERLLGPTHPMQAVALAMLATYRSHTADYDAAIELSDRALALLQATPSFLPNLRATTHSVRGIALLLLRRDEAAADALEQALREQVAHVGPDSTHTITTRDNLSLVYRRLGRTPDAMAQLERAIAIGTEHAGAKPVTTANARLNLAVLYVQEERVDDALELLALAREVMDPHHPASSSQSASYWRTVANVYMRASRLKDARDAMDRALDSIEEARVGDAGEGRVLSEDARLREQMGRRDEVPAVVAAARAKLRAAGEAGREELQALDEWAAQIGLED